MFRGVKICSSNITLYTDSAIGQQSSSNLSATGYFFQHLEVNVHDIVSEVRKKTQIPLNDIHVFVFKISTIYMEY